MTSLPAADALPTGPWSLWASREERADGQVCLRHIGPRAWVKLHFLSSPIVPVLVQEDPEGAFYGWLDSESSSERPAFIWEGKLLFEMCFSSGSKASQEAVEQRGGQARVVRLTIEEVVDPATVAAHPMN